MIVVDTNIIAYLVINGEFTSMAERVLRKEPEWACPILWQSELSNILVLYVRKGILTLSNAQEQMTFALDLIGQGNMVVPRNFILGVAAQSVCSSYACEFVTLAQILDVPLVTNDKQVLKEFPGTAITMEDFVVSSQ